MDVEDLEDIEDILFRTSRRLADGVVLGAIGESCE
jgi:hypothetical protein